MANVEMSYLNASGNYETIYPKVDLTNITGTLPVANGGTGTTSLNSLMTNMGAARIQTGSYTGTGTYGASNPCSLTFNFVPVFISIYSFIDDSGDLGVVGNSSYGKSSQTNQLMSYSMVNTSIATTTYKKPGFGLWYTGQTNATYYSYWKCSKDRKTYYWYSISHDGSYGNNEYQLNKNKYTYYYYALG